MKRILIALLLFGFLITTLCACSPEMREYPSGSANISDDPSPSVDQAEETGAAYEESPILPPFHDRFIFHSEEELCARILSGECDDEALLSLTEYYRPKTLEPDLVLSEIYVKGAYVGLRYDLIAKEDAEGDPDVYWLFEWYRKLKPENLKDELNRVFRPGAVKQIDEFFFVGGEVLQDVFWEQDGNIFHAAIPVNISSSRLRAFCDNELVLIQHQEQ